MKAVKKIQKRLLEEALREAHDYARILKDKWSERYNKHYKQVLLLGMLVTKEQLLNVEAKPEVEIGLERKNREEIVFNPEIWHSKKFQNKKYREGVEREYESYAKR